MLSLALTSLSLRASLLAEPSPSPTGDYGGIDLGAKPKAIPGLGPQINEWIGYVKTAAIAAGVIGILICSIMMMVGRRNRSHLSAEGATGLIWVLFGLSIASMAGGIVAGILG
jgi:hypothetical protein